MTGLRKLEYGIPGDNSGLHVRFGIEKGFFAEEGIDLSMRIVYGGPEVARAYEAGELQFGQLGSPPGINAIARGAAFKIVGSGIRRKAFMYLGVRSDITSFAELKGGRLGMLGLGSCSEWIARKMYLAEGLDPDRDLTFVPLKDSYPAVVTLMRQGRFEATVATEPSLSLGETEGVLKVWKTAYEPSCLPNYQWVILVARPDFIEREPEILRAALRGCQRSARYAAAHPEEWTEFLARRFTISREAARRTTERELAHYELDCRVDMEGLQQSIRVQRELGAIDQEMRAGDLVDLRFLPEVVPA